MASPLDRVLIMIPAFNESEIIESTIAEVRKALPGVGLVVLDDGSRDDTAAKALEAGARVLQLPYNLGVGGAIRLGFRYAEANHYLIAIQLDADGQHNPSDVPLLLEQLHEKNVDVVIGARFAGAGNYSVRGPRKLAMKFLSAVLSRATKTQLTDTTSGFKAHGTRAIHLYAREFPAEYLGDTIESLVLGHRAGLTFSQVAVTMRERAGGVPSHNPTKSAFYLLRAFFALAVAFLRPAKKAMDQV